MQQYKSRLAALENSVSHLTKLLENFGNWSHLRILEIENKVLTNILAARNEASTIAHYQQSPLSRPKTTVEIPSHNRNFHAFGYTAHPDTINQNSLHYQTADNHTHKQQCDCHFNVSDATALGASFSPTTATCATIEDLTTMSSGTTSMYTPLGNDLFNWQIGNHALLDAHTGGECRPHI